MDEPTTYRLVIRGVAGERVLRPFDGVFAVETGPDWTRLTGVVTDAAHLHGLLVHLTSLHAEVLSVTAVHHTERNDTP